MIIAGHYKRTGAHIFSSISRSGQSLMVLTGEECRLCEQCVCVRKRQKGSAVSGQHSLFQFFVLNPLLCLGMSCWVTQSCERERERRKKRSPSLPAAAQAVQSIQGNRTCAKQNGMVQHLGILVTWGMGFVKQKGMQVLPTEREKGEPLSVENSSSCRGEQWWAVRAKAERTGMVVMKPYHIW